MAVDSERKDSTNPLVESMRRDRSIIDELFVVVLKKVIVSPTPKEALYSK